MYTISDPPYRKQFMVSSRQACFSSADQVVAIASIFTRVPSISSCTAGHTHNDSKNRSTRTARRKVCNHAVEG